MCRPRCESCRSDGERNQRGLKQYSVPAFLDEVRTAIPTDQLVEVDAHINDQAFADEALNILDRWVAEGSGKT